MHKQLQVFTGFATVFFLSGCGGGTTSPTVIGAVTTVSISAPSTTVVAGGTLQLTAAPTDANGNAVPGLTATWASSNTPVATVNSSGLVSGIAAGTVTITGTVSGIPGSKQLTVAAIPATATVQATTAITFDPAQVDITAGGSVTWAFQSVGHNVAFSGSAAGTPASIGGTNSNTSIARTFTTAGTFNYTCTLHAGMSGTVIVH